MLKDKVQGTEYRVQGGRFSCEDLIGKPFRYGGRGPLEYDCYGLCMEVYKRLGVTLPDFGSSPSASWIHRMILEQTRDEGRGTSEVGSRKLPPTSQQSGPPTSYMFMRLPAPEPWCLVTFWIRPGYTTHIGVVLEDGNKFLHILQKERAVIERIDSKIWQHRITGFYSFNPEPCTPDPVP